MSQRKAFEAWFEDQHITIEDADVDIAWASWQAAICSLVADNNIEPVGAVIGFDNDTGHAIVEHACEGPYGPLEEHDCIYNSDQLHAFGAAVRVASIEECAKLIEDEEEDGLPLETLANAIRALLGKEAT